MQEINKNENISTPVVTKPKEHTATRKIGNTTFLVSSRFKEGKEGDIVSTFARLLQYDADKQYKA
ncbi:hypothetical protein [Faecalispora jeddahensis]|uniref:hypothetical protein n=1 Tax=Faecalispora jeddahensis TaxID=1414721 RepID=UPI001898C1A4|nr:hypothetical protein [Faecalispora jeddahensis]